MEDAFKRLEEVDRDTALLKVERKKSGRRPVLATTYDPRQPDIPGR